MESIRQTQKRYGSRALTAAIFIGFGLIIAGQTGVGKGLILGTLFSVINFILIGESLPLRLRPSRGKAVLLSLGSLFVRFGLLALPVVYSMKSDQFHPVAVVFGLFSVQLLLLLEHVYGSMLMRFRKQM